MAKKKKIIDFYEYEYLLDNENNLYRLNGKKIEVLGTKDGKLAWVKSSMDVPLKVIERYELISTCKNLHINYCELYRINNE